MKFIKSSINKEEERVSSIFSSKLPRLPNSNSLSPGPGYYKTVDVEKRVNYNLKGNGNGFLSKVDRVPSLSYNNVPGPGYYKLKDQFVRTSMKSIQNQTENKKKAQNKGNFPGPGDYNITKFFKLFKDHNPATSINSNTQRIIVSLPSIENPAPGRYNPYSYEDHRYLKVKAKADSLQSLKLQREKQAQKAQFEKELILELQKQRKSHLKPEKTKGKIIPLKKLHSNSTGNEGKVGENMGIDRNRIPSPGKYNLLSAKPIINNISNIVFKSETKRFNP